MDKFFNKTTSKNKEDTIKSSGKDIDMDFADQKKKDQMEKDKQALRMKNMPWIAKQ